MIQIDDITQQNAALVEQAAAAAGNLVEQARNVSQAMAVFKLQHGARSGARPAMPPARPAPVRAKPKLVAHS